MAEAGTESFRNNLCQNQLEKQMQKRFSARPATGLPELSNSMVVHRQLLQDCPGAAPMHNHSYHSYTEIKEPLDAAPALTPAGSENSLNRNQGQRAASLHSASSMPNVAPLSAMSSVSSRQSLSNGPGTPSDQGKQQGSDVSDPLSTYLRAGMPSNPSTFNAVSTLPPSASEDKNIATNDLSNNASPQPMLQYPMMAALPPFQGGGVMYYMPVNNVPGVQSAPVFFGTLGQSHLPTPQMIPNIACPPQPQEAKNGSGISPLTATFGGNVIQNQAARDARNLPPNLQGASGQSSEENNSNGSRSYSISPGYETHLLRLRKPVLEELRKNLDIQCENNWEALADCHGLDYMDIRSHLDDCRHRCESPFLKLLDKSCFQDYTVKDFMDDMLYIGRKDILRVVDSILQNKPRS